MTGMAQPVCGVGPGIVWRRRRRSGACHPREHRYQRRKLFVSRLAPQDVDSS